MEKRTKSERSNPDFARGVDREDGRRDVHPDYARGQDQSERVSGKYDTDYARGLDAERRHEARPDFARGVEKEGG